MVCEYRSAIFLARIEGERHLCHEAILKYVQKAPDDIRWEIDRNEFHEHMATKKGTRSRSRWDSVWSLQVCWRVWLSVPSESVKARDCGWSCPSAVRCKVGIILDGIIGSSDPEVFADQVSDLSSSKETVFFVSFHSSRLTSYMKRVPLSTKIITVTGLLFWN